MNGKPKHIGIVTCVLLLLAAVIADLSGAVLALIGIGIFANTLIAIIFYAPLTFWQFFTNRLNRKSGLYTIMFGVVSLIPLFNALPECIAQVVMLMLVNNSKELTGVLGKVAAPVKALQKIDTFSGAAVSATATKAAGMEVNIQGSSKKIQPIVPKENINLEPLKSAKAELDLRDAKYNKQKTEQNTLDLQNKRQEAAHTGTNLPSRGESPLPRQVKNATMGDENEEQLAA